MRLTDTISFRKVGNLFAAVFYGNCIGLGKSVHCIILPSILSALRHHIVHVLSLATNPQMRWIHADLIIAFVKNQFVARHWTNTEHPCGFVCIHAASASFSFSDLAISRARNAGSPKPASSKFWSMFWNWPELVYFIPKAIWECVRKSLRKCWVLFEWFWHDQVLLIVSTLPASPEARGQLNLP